MKDVDLSQFYGITIASNATAAVMAALMAFFVVRLKLRRPDFFSHTWAAWPVALFFLSSATVHASLVGSIYVKMRMVFMAMGVAHASFSVLAAVSCGIMYKTLVKAPSNAALKAVNDALAKTLGDINAGERR